MAVPQPKNRAHIGKYEVLGTLGRGSMGVVYKARDPEIDRIVAIKTLRTLASGAEQNQDEALERFKSEARSAGNLRHPNIVTIFEISRDADTPFIVMDFVEGQSLESIIAKSGALPPMAALYYLLQVASALDFAHIRGVIHRDIKPANLHIDKHGRIYILDFGVAAFRQELNQQEAGGAIVGTPGYMSPEQILSEPLDTRSDLFSLAGVAFECFTGKRPFAGETFSDVMGNILAGNLTPLTELNPGLPLALEAEFERALQRERGLRFATATEMIEEFCAALGVDPSVVRNSPSVANLPDLPRKKKSSGWQMLSPRAAGEGIAQPLQGVTTAQVPEQPQGTAKSTTNVWDLESKPLAVDVHKPQAIGISREVRPSSLVSDKIEGLQRIVAARHADTERESKSLRRLTLVFAGICIALGSGLLFLVTAGIDDVASVAPTTEVRVGVQAEQAPALVNHDAAALVMPTVERAPRDLPAAALNDKQLLGLLIDEQAPEGSLIHGIQEAQRRNVVGLVDVSPVILRNRSYLVRVEMVKALAKRGDRRIVPELMLRLDDEDALVRGHAARALGILGDRRALGYLSMRHAKEESEQAKQAMQRAIERIQGFPMP
jgi:serine/threonine-protein kinase